MALLELAVQLILAGFLGGMIGTAIGALPALSLAGILIVVGELANLGSEKTATVSDLTTTVYGLDITALEFTIPGTVGVSLFAPHVAFAGGVAAAAYTGRKSTTDTTFRYHQAKQITKPLGTVLTNLRRLAVGGAFGLFGALFAAVLVALDSPVDPVMATIVVSGFLHRLAFGYLLVGRVGNLDRSVLDMSPFEANTYWEPDSWGASQGIAGRHVVEVWQPSYYEWQTVTALGAGVGVAAGLLAYVSESAFLAFGIAAASLGLLSFGYYSIPVTHHIALPAGMTALAIPEAGPVVALAVAGIFGVLGAVGGEIAQRTLYAHGDTHLDPPAVSIVLTSLLISVLAAIGVFDGASIPYL